ncbi:hypothetical protein [Modicisalibacter zincidurans]|nr:hypothetical protein [Halomonas zincidurans]
MTTTLTSPAAAASDVSDNAASATLTERPDGRTAPPCWPAPRARRPR